MNSATDHTPALLHGLECNWNQGADRCEDYCRVERFRRRLVGRTCPDSSKWPRKIWRALAATTGKRKYTTAESRRNLDQNMRRCAKTVETKRLPPPRHPVASPADKSCAKPRRNLRVFTMLP